MNSNMNSNVISKFFQTLLVACLAVSLGPNNSFATETEKKDPDKLDPNGSLVFTGEGKAGSVAKLNMSALKRLDFRVEGASCAICLGRIRKRIEVAKGIAKVAVAIQKPYGVAVIYDSSKTEKEKIFQAGLKGEKEKVLFLDEQEEKVDKMPFILIPKFNSLVKG